MRYLNPKADLAFKRVFGEHPDLVVSLLGKVIDGLHLIFVELPKFTPQSYADEEDAFRILIEQEGAYGIRTVG